MESSQFDPQKKKGDASRHPFRINQAELQSLVMSRFESEVVSLSLTMDRVEAGIV